MNEYLSSIILGKYEKSFLCKLSIDKLCGLCYNGNNAPAGSWAARRKKMPPRGLPLGGLSSILNSRPAVSSQSTGLAGRCRLLGAGEPHPKTKSKS